MNQDRFNSFKITVFDVVFVHHFDFLTQIIGHDENQIRLLCQRRTGEQAKETGEESESEKACGFHERV
jgi:hypothetical protein